MIDISKAKPILFSTPMVQAILKGRKTMTRRVIKLPNWAKPIGLEYLGSGKLGAAGKRTDQLSIIFSKYMPGTILWVRETWCHDTFMTCVGGTTEAPWYENIPIDYKFRYYADDPEYAYQHDQRWKPSIHMPRKAARIFLRVTDVRVELLQSITEEDALKEGFKPGYESIGNGKFEDALEREWTAVDEFRELWQELNLKRGYGWDVNPWVWVYEFEDVTKEVLADG